jgi:enoyl-CoA hydratase/carnithine racemase
MLDGCAVGFGADLALACDLRVATRESYVQEKFVKIGLMPDGGGTFWLPRLIGTARAMRWMLLADKIDGAELESLGLVMNLASQGELRDATLSVARELEKGPPLAFAQIKRAVYGSWGELEEALRREREGQLQLLRSQDAMEGIMAWASKREPTFEGK